MKLNHVLAATLYFLLLNCHAQDFALSGDDIEWSEGQVTLTNGVTLKGAVRYNSKSGLLAFDSGSESKVLTPRSVSSFDYYDAIRQNQRKFYSLELEDAKGIVKPQFFEVLKELKTFAQRMVMFQPRRFVDQRRKGRGVTLGEGITAKRRQFLKHILGDGFGYAFALRSGNEIVMKFPERPRRVFGSQSAPQ
jgi:hypothetical protein